MFKFLEERKKIPENDSDECFQERHIEGSVHRQTLLLGGPEIHFQNLPLSQPHSHKVG